MPHIILKMQPGRSEEVKKELTEKITKVLEDVANASNGSISIDIQEIKKESWNEEVYNPEIKAKMDKLYKKPNY